MTGSDGARRDGAEPGNWSRYTEIVDVGGGDGTLLIDGCARAAGRGSSVIVIEELRGADTARNLTHAVAAGGRERTAKQLIGLGQACGLSLRGTTRVAGRRAALEFVGSG
jgi:hypothetical protein